MFVLTYFNIICLYCLDYYYKRSLFILEHARLNMFVPHCHAVKARHMKQEGIKVLSESNAHASSQIFRQHECKTCKSLLFLNPALERNVCFCLIWSSFCCHWKRRYQINCKFVFFHTFFFPHIAVSWRVEQSDRMLTY